MKFWRYKPLYGLVAQLVRAPPCHGGGHGFESRLGRLWWVFIHDCMTIKSDEFHLTLTTSNAWDLSSAGRASALQAEGHRFEPCRSHFFKPMWLNWQSSWFVISRLSVRVRSSALYNLILNCIMGRFPSGQRGQTVNLLQLASMVRIHLCPLLFIE